MSFDVEAERKKLSIELIAEAITKEHPKVKDLIAEACSNLQEKMHQ
jgi:glycerate kinase